MTTTDLSDFGAREKEIAEQLLRAMRVSGLPEDFEDSEVTVMFNRMSGNVFLTNSEYQVAMLVDEENSDKLASFYSSPYNGTEGFFEDLKDEYKDMHPEDQEWFRQLNEDYYQEILPMELSDGTWIEEGEEYYTLEEQTDGSFEVIESNYDENTDDDPEVSKYSSEINAWKAIAEEYCPEVLKEDIPEDNLIELIRNKARA